MTRAMGILTTGWRGPRVGGEQGEGLAIARRGEEASEAH